MRVPTMCRRVRPVLLAGLVCMLAATTALGAPPPEKVALTGAKIITVNGPVIEKGTVLIERGKIAAVGKDVEVPYDARVFDVSGKVVFPGMVVAHTSRGMDVANEPRPITPQLDAGDALDPSQLFFEDCLRLGHTVVHVIPGNNTVIGGLGRTVRPIGLTVDEMTLVPGEFLKLSTSGRFDRMMQMAQLREAFLELDDYLNQAAEKRYEEKLKEDDKKIDVGPAEARKRGRDLLRPQDIDDQHRNLLRLRGGQVRVNGTDGPTLFKPLGAFMGVERAMDVALAVQFAKDNNFFDRTVLVLGGECYKAIDELKAAARPVVLSAELLYRETNPLTGEIKETFVPRLIYDAGLKFALLPMGEDLFGERMLTYQAARCVREGVPRDAALRAITLNPAEMLGLGDRFGSIEVGKDAHLVVFSGDPLDFNSVVEQVFIDGIPAYERSKDVRLQKLLSEGLEDVKPSDDKAKDDKPHSDKPAKPAKSVKPDKQEKPE